MAEESNPYIENINVILNERNTGPVTKKIELEILANNFCSRSSPASDTNFLRFTSRYSLALKILDQQINN